MSTMMLILAGLMLLVASAHDHGVSDRHGEINHHQVRRCLENERLALLYFKQGLVDPGYSLSSWTNSSNSDCCTWTAIRCDNRTNHVIMLDLSSYGLGGLIGPSLVELQYLEQLSFYWNHFTQIPKFLGSFKRLTSLDLGENPISGAIPSQLGNLTKLQNLNLWSTGNQMVVDNLECLSHLPSLTFFELHGANFTKAGLRSFKMPPSLSFLQLSHCQFPEVDSSSLSHVNSSDSLQTLNLISNSIHSTTISWLFNSNSNIVELTLAYNYMAGAFNSFHLKNLTKLNYLYLDFEMIDSNFEWLSHLPSLTSFQLFNTNFTKTGLQSFKMPPSLSSLQLSECHFPQVGGISSPFSSNSSNSLTSLRLEDNTIYPTVLAWLLNSSTNLVDLVIYRNFIDGFLPNSFQKMNFILHIDISSNVGLGNQIPKSLGNLTNLQTLYLANNNLNGTLQALLKILSGCLRNSLETLDWSGNQLLGGLVLDNMNGKSFPSLRELQLSYNLLEGPLPDLSTLSSLRKFYASNNRFNSTLTESIGQLHSLEILDLSSNTLSGVVSEVHFQKLSKLKVLDLSSNSFTLSFNSNWVPPFQLTNLLLSSCKLGSQFPTWIQYQPNLSFLDISNSGISGAIPHWFSDLTAKMRHLNLSFNHMNGTFPNFPLMSENNPTVDLSFNHFRGSIPPSLSNATGLYLSNNKFSRLESFLCESVNGVTKVLDLSNNLLSGSLPDCWWSLKDLSILILENNHLSGVIPSSISLLNQLIYLSLKHNNFSGSLPPLCTDLQVLDIEGNNLEGEIPTWIGESLLHLVLLRLKSNRLYGSMPPSLCNLQLLQILDLSVNNISGAIPSCIHNLTSMVQGTGEGRASLDVIFPIGTTDVSYETSAIIMWKGVEYKYKEILGLLRIIDLSSNKLAGVIPDELQNLVELVQLNLSRNNLSGAIPENIGKLSKLESLDMSHNNLSGKIPESLAEVFTLDYLDLSSNHLSRRIPTSTQLQSFNASVYAGNLELCGKPSTTTCPGDETLKGPPNSDNRNESLDKDNGEWFDKSWFPMGIGVGFVVGFCGVCGNLLLITSRRLAYFRYLNELGDWIYVLIAVKWAKIKRRLSI